MLARFDPIHGTSVKSAQTRCARLLILGLVVGCERESPIGPANGAQQLQQKPVAETPTFSTLPGEDVSRSLRTSAAAIVDALGAATPTTQFSVFGAGGASVNGFQFPGPQFILTEPTTITEMGGFLNNCRAIVSGVPDCPGTLPFTVQIRPSTGGVPNPSTVLASFVLSHDNDPLLISYESSAMSLTLGPGSYFAMFAPQGGDEGLLLDNASIPFNYQAGSITMGFFFPLTGTSSVQPNSFGAVRILGTPTTGGAIVSNSGEGKPDVFCRFGEFTTTDGTAVRSPSGNATLSCRFENLAPIPSPETLKGWLCTINQGGLSETRQSQWVRSPSGSAQVTCQFSGKPLNDAAVSFGTSAAAAQQGSFTAPLIDAPGQRVIGDVINIGRACNGDPLTGDPTGRIALIERGFCLFTEKLTNALNAGAIAATVYNSAAGGEEIITMGGLVNVPIPGVFVARSTGLALQAAAPTRVAITYCTRSASCRGMF